MKLIIGGANTGKTSHLLQEITQGLASGGSPLLIVPTRMRKDSVALSIAQEIRGFAGKTVMTLQETVEYVFRSSRFGQSNRSVLISEFEAFLLVKFIVRDYRDSLSYFRDAGQYDSVVKMIFSLLTELRAANIWNPQNPSLQIMAEEQAKWRDICFIYDKFREKLENRGLHDSFWLFRTAGEILEQEPLFGDYDALYFDGFFDFTQTQFHFLQKLIVSFQNRSLPVTGTLPVCPVSVIRETRKWFETAPALHTQIEERAAGESLAASLFAPFDAQLPDSPLQVTEINAFGKYREVEIVANEIQRLIIREGYTFNDIAVITRDFESYERFFHSVFSGFDIPYYQSKDEPLRNNPVIIFIFSLIQYAINGIDNVGILGMLNSNYNGNPEWRKLGGIDRYFPHFIQGFAEDWKKEWQTRARYFQERAHSGYYDDGQDGREAELLYREMSASETVFRDFLNRLFLLRKKSAIKIGDFIQWLAGMLEGLGIQKAIHHYPAKESENPWLITRDFTAFRRLKEVLQDLKRTLTIYGQEEFPLTELAKIFETLIREVRYRYQFYPADSVKILSPFDARETHFKAVFICGLNEGEFPGRPALTIADNSERLKLNRLASALLLHTDESRLDLDKLDFYVAVSRATERVYLCHTPFDDKGNRILPSIFLLSLRNRLGKNLNYIPGSSEENLDDRIRAIFEIVPSQTWLDLYSLRLLLTNDYHLIDDKRKKELYSDFPFLRQAGEMGDYYRAIRKVNAYYRDHSALPAEGMEYFGAIPSRPETTRKFIRQKLNGMEFSASSLEMAGNCRYQFFARYLLGIQEETYPKEELELKIIGLFFHRVLELYLTETRDKTAGDLPDWSTLEQAIQSAFEEMRYSEANTRLLEMEMENLHEVLGNFVIFDRDELRRDFQPHSSEMKFKGMPIEIRPGKSISVQGMIDRVDLSSGNFRVTDYKTGSVEYIKDKLKLPFLIFQGFLYSEAVRNKSTEDLLPAAITYASIRNRQTVDILDAGQNGYREMWEIKKKEIDTLLKWMEEGQFPPFTPPGILAETEELNSRYQDEQSGNQLEYKNKCAFCVYQDLCLREDKLSEIGRFD